MDFRSIDRKRLLLGIVIIVGVCLIIGIVISFIYASLNKNVYGNGIVITNFNEKVKNLPKEREDSISSVLYKTVQLNLPSGQKVPEIRDATIRDGSEKQQEVIKNVQYTGSFIVDIKSLRQSYNVQYSYSSDKDDILLSGYAALATCLETKDLIYGSFNCKDLVLEESKDVDSIVYQLPREALHYNIAAIQGDDKVVKLQIDLHLSQADQSNKDASIQSYKDEALSWIKSQGFDPDKYPTTYSY